MFGNVCSNLGYTKLRIKAIGNAKGYLWGYLELLLGALVCTLTMLAMLSS